jgi:D-alanyl-D-alanine dipeptidase
MVGFMRWVHSKSLAFLFAVFLPLTAGIVWPYVLSDSNTPSAVVVEEAQQKTFCFDLENLVTLATANPFCPTEFTFLGDQPLSESPTASGIVDEIHPLLLSRFEAAATFARADGITLFITSGFRSLDRQETLFEEAMRKYGSETEAAKWVLPPRYSHHPQGLAMDINYPGDKPGALWLEKNGYRFGLCRVYANEWWHFEGVVAPGQSCPPLAPNALVDMKVP